MLEVDSPPDLGMVQAVVRKVSNFEFELDDFIKEDLWGFKNEEKLSPYVLQAGYDSNVLMYSMGLELYFTIIYLLLIVILFPIKCCCSKAKRAKLQAFED
jgi:hypothetical protein